MGAVLGVLREMALALHCVVPMANLKNKIDDAAAKAKDAVGNAGKAVQGAAKKLSDRTNKLARSINSTGSRAGNKLGA